MKIKNCINKMELNIALITYLVVLIVSFLLFLYINYTVFAAGFLAFIVALIYLNIAYPVTSDELSNINSLTVLYIFIQIFTLFVILIYALIITIGQKRNRSKFPMRYE